MIWLDVALRASAFAWTVIATLRAGSRVVYLMDHDAIGIMDEGSLICKPASKINETEVEAEISTKGSVWELSEAFRHCVRLSKSPQYYENVQTKKPVLTVVEPYPLSSRPYLENKMQDREETSIGIKDLKGALNNPVLLEQLFQNLQDPKVFEEFKQIQDNPEFQEELMTDNSELLELVDAILRNETVDPMTGNSEPEPPSFFKRQYAFTKQLFWAVPATISSVPSMLKNTGNYVILTPKLASYYARRAWYWRRWKEEESDLEDAAEELDWDYNWSTEGQLRFDSSDGAPRVAELAVFSPNAFQNLRSVFGVSEEAYWRSIFGAGPFVSFQSNSKGAARVGGIFFFTRDGAFMIKTIKKEEAKTFLKMLPKYHRHMRRYARTSLLTRFCGMYGVRLYDEDSADPGKLHTIVVMNAVFPAEASHFISERFDLKGSTVGREVSEEELQTKGKNAVLKDLDLAREVEQVRSNAKNEEPVREYGFSIGATCKAAILSQLRQDVRSLVDCQVMDYSLLVGVVNMETHLKLDRSARNAVVAIQEHGRSLSRSKKFEERALWAIGAPLRLLSAPPAFLARQLWNLSQLTLSSVVTWPLPYYGSGRCGVDGGLFSVIHGRRNGNRAVYYLGLIDFLQPWTTRKVWERRMKGVLGYDTTAISAVTPEEYASRFLDFLDAHLS